MNDSPESFNRSAFEGQLATREIGRDLRLYQSVESTMPIAAEAARAGAAHGAAILAEEQTAGRGRQGRSFWSPPGANIYVTMVLRGPIGELRSLPLAVPAAVCLAVRSEGVEAGIKWPNDIFAQGKKLCGMLIDSEIVGTELLAFPGIGINVNSDPTQVDELRDIATSLRLETGSRIPRERLLANLCNELERLLAAPPAELGAIYRELSVVLGKEVTVLPRGGEPFDGVAVDVADDGALQVRRSDGKTEIVRAADVSLRARGLGERSDR